MKTIILQPGQTLAAIAAREKMPIDRIWNDRANDGIRARRKTPECLLPKDPIVIPDKTQKTVRHRTSRIQEKNRSPKHVVVRRDPDLLRLVLLVDGEPCAGATCTIEIEKMEPRKTDDDGKVEFRMPPQVGPFRMRVDLPRRDAPEKYPHAVLPARSRTLSLSIGHLENELALFQARLTNLGFRCDPIDGKLDEYGHLPVRTRQAFLRFRKAFFLDQYCSDRAQSFDSLDDVRKGDPRSLEELVRRYETNDRWSQRFTDEDKLCRLQSVDASGARPGSVTHHVLTGTRWNRINILEGPEVIIDSHMHIMTGKCSPLTLVWDKLPVIGGLRLSRTSMSEWVTPTMGAIDDGTKQTQLLAKEGAHGLAAHAEGLARLSEEELKLLATSLARTLILTGYAGVELLEGEISSLNGAAALVDVIAKEWDVRSSVASGAGRTAAWMERKLRAAVPDQPAPATEIALEATGLGEQIVVGVVRAYAKARDAIAEAGRKAANAVTEAEADRMKQVARDSAAAAQLSADLAAVHRAAADRMRKFVDETNHKLDLVYEDASRLVEHVAQHICKRIHEVATLPRDYARTIDRRSAAAVSKIGALETFAEMGDKNTDQIAKDSVTGNDDAYRPVPAATEGGQRLSLMMVMPMDMDFGHIAGYEGKPVYEPTDTRREIRVETRVQSVVTACEYRPLPPDTKLPVGKTEVLAESYVDESGHVSYGSPPTGTIPTPRFLPNTLEPADVPGDPKPVAGPQQPGVIQFSTTSQVAEVKGGFFRYSQHVAPPGWPERLPRKGHYDLPTESRWLPDEEWEKYVDYDRQLKQIRAAAAAHPWRLIPLFHYDPRRWKEASGTPGGTSRVITGKVVDKEGKVSASTREFKAYPRAWDEPFNEYFQKGGPRPYVGMKMYTSLGYRPLDRRLPNQREYYRRCVELELPIVAHCSPAGQYTTERPLYVLEEDRTNLHFDLKRARDETQELMCRRGITDHAVLVKDWPEHWFCEKYASPFAWREVLTADPKLKDLRLCLAHFGGDTKPFTSWSKLDPPAPRADLLQGGWDPKANLTWDEAMIKLAHEYPNVHIDISYFVFDDLRRRRLAGLLESFPHLRDKILFGTDWWMIEMDGLDYKTYVGQTRQALDQIDPELWFRFTWINPVRFYRLKENASAIADALAAAPGTDNERKKRQKRIDKNLSALHTLEPGVRSAR